MKQIIRLLNSSRLVLLLLGLVVLPSLGWGADEQLVLGIGLSQEIKTPHGVAVHVSNGSVAKVIDAPSGLKITGRKIGECEIQFSNQKILVHVLGDAEFHLYQALLEQTKRGRGLEVTVQGKVIAVIGQLLRFDDWSELANTARLHSANYIFRAHLNAKLQRLAQSHFKEVLRDAHLPELPLEFSPAATAVIPLEPKDLKARVERTLGAYGFQIEHSETAVSLEPMVRVRLLVTELKKSLSRKIGIAWPPSLPAQLLPQPQIGTGESWGPQLDAIEENGLGKILASPILLCRSGKEAKFLAGGEIPIKVVNFKIQDIVWKQYGILLKIHPRADDSGRMSIGIETEVSMLDEAHKVDGVPGLLTNRIESHFDLNSSRTIVLSGLIKKEWGKKATGLPWLVDIPVLGALFGSTDYQDDRTELVVFVTPEIARPDDEKLNQ
jgi:pilus assembly protein CpaC